MSKVVFAYNNGIITFPVFPGVPQVRPEHPNYMAIKKLLNVRDSENEIKRLLVSTPVQQVFRGADAQLASHVEFKDGVVYYNGEKVHNVVAERIIRFQEEGLPFDGLLKFLDKLFSNPSYKSREDLYYFLENRNLPVTEDGDFLAYKAVREDYFDQYTGKTYKNIPGATISMPRHLVDDDHNRHCSKGLHVGAMDYVTSYGAGNYRIVVCKVNPRDAVSVPRDCSFMKLRVCEYYVVKEYEADMTQPLYTASAAPVKQAPISQDYTDQQFASEFDDDEFDADDITATYADVEAKVGPVYGVKPNGSNYHNKRDASGRFAPKN